MAKRLSVVYDDDLHLYKVNGEDVVSVTQILDKTVPKQLTYWGYRIGLAAAVHLIETRSWPALQQMDAKDLEREVRVDEAADKTLELSPNRVRDSAGDDGTAVHKAIELFHQTGGLPSIDDFEPEMRGFIQAFSQFILEQDPEVEETEVIVAHPEQRYAGRLDLIARFGDRGRGLTDFKTSRRTKTTKTRGTEAVFEVYESFHAQLRLYEEGYVATETFHGKDEAEVRPDFRAIVFLHENGQYALMPAVQADWAMKLPGIWWDMHRDGLFKAPWETDPQRRKNGLKRTNAAPAK